MKGAEMLERRQMRNDARATRAAVAHDEQFQQYIRALTAPPNPEDD